MSLHAPSEAASLNSARHPLWEQVGVLAWLRGWLLAQMDRFLSAPLRSGSPTELIRYRVLVGATFVPLLFGLLNLIHGLLSSQASIPKESSPSLTPRESLDS
jgi:hypothetical protein